MNQRNPYTDEIIRLCSEGLKVSRIAEQLGVKKQLVSSVLANARKRGDIDAFKPGEGVSRRGRPVVGSTIEMLDALTGGEYQWLLNELPEGSTLAEFFGAMISDAYYESTQDA